MSAFNRHCGIDVHELTPREVGEMWPLARTDDLLAEFYVAEDGRANPVDVTWPLAKGARMQGDPNRRGHPGHLDARRPPGDAAGPGAWGAHRARRHRVRGGGELRRHVGPPAG